MQEVIIPSRFLSRTLVLLSLIMTSTQNHNM